MTLQNGTLRLRRQYSALALKNDSRQVNSNRRNMKIIFGNTGVYVNNANISKRLINGRYDK